MVTWILVIIMSGNPEINYEAPFMTRAACVQRIQDHKKHNDYPVDTTYECRKQ